MRDGSGSSLDAGLACVALVSEPAIEFGMLSVPRDDGRCCHFSVPLRVGSAALGDGFEEASDGSYALDESGVEGVLVFLTAPKPLNSGISFVGEPDRLLASVASILAPELNVEGGGDVTEEALTGVRICLRFEYADTGVKGFSGDIDLARSV